jgi:membrane-bound inhibitor of C-type lysozyme
MRALLLPLPMALAVAAPAQDVAPGFAADYRCDGGATLQVAYLNPPAGPALAVVAYAGALIPMEAGPTGLGVRYVGFDRSAGFVWHTKGDEGFLAREQDGTQSTLLGGCVRRDG